MTDPLSVAASLVAVITVALKSIKLLHGTVSRFKGRDKTLGRLQNELEDIMTVLDSLEQVIQTEASMAELLQGPINRCSKICQEFRQSMESFSNKSKAGFRDWTKLEFMKGDINEFIDTLSGYKATISVGLGTITIRIAKVSQKTLQDYNEMIQDTVYNLKVHLQRVDEKMVRYTADNSSAQASSVNLDDEKEVTQLCLHICEDARSYIDSLTKREARVLEEQENTATDDELKNFEAQLLTRQTLNESREGFAKIILQLRIRLETLIMKNDPGDEKERARLMDDINTSKQCLEVCKVASEVSSQKIYRIGEVIADGDSDQVVVTTLADLFDVRKALSRGTSAQLVGSMGEETLRHMTEKRYNSRFGAVIQRPDNTQTVIHGSASVVEGKEDQRASPNAEGRVETITSYRGSSPNEVRKRV